jgi:predicted TIM-barrel fold metal-dependent hydrolase
MGGGCRAHHTDPVAFFRPHDRFNERWEELCRHPDWHYPPSAFPSFEALIDQFEHVVARHPRTTFIGAHMGGYAENLTWVDRMLSTYPNFYVDMAARLAELGRQPYSAKRLFEKHPERIMFGLDFSPPQPKLCAPYFRFLETADEYFPYHPHRLTQGRWNIYGIDLADAILQQIYHDTAVRVFNVSGRGEDTGR